MHKADFPGSGGEQGTAGDDMNIKSGEVLKGTVIASKTEFRQ